MAKKKSQKLSSVKLPVNRRRKRSSISDGLEVTKLEPRNGNEDSSSYVTEYAWLTALQSLPGLADFGEVLKAMRSGINLTEAIAYVGKQRGVSVHTKVYGIKSKLKKLFGLDLFTRRGGESKSLYAPTGGQRSMGNPVRQEWCGPPIDGEASAAKTASPFGHRRRNNRHRSLGRLPI